MADWTLPLLSDLKVDVLDMLKLRDVDAITLSETPTTPPVGAVRWWRAQSKFQTWSGTAWVDLVISMQGGGTGATTPGGITAGLGLKTMAYQDSNAVAITGGYINGLAHPGGGWALAVSGNTVLGGIVYAGSAPTNITNSAGQLVETSIDNIAAIAHINQNEVVSGSWTFNGGVFTVNVTANFNGPAAFAQSINAVGGISTPQVTISTALPQIWLTDLDGAADAKHFRIAHDANQINFNFYSDTLASAQSALYFDHAGYVVTRVGMSATNRVEINTPNIAVRPAAGGDALIRFYAGNATSKGFLCFGDSDGLIGGMYNNNTTNYFDANQHVWRTSNGGTQLATLDYGGRFTPSGITTVTNEAYYARGYSHVRIHSKEESRPAGQQTYVFMNYAGNFSIIPTSDDGGSPVGSDWAYSLMLNRNGQVLIGAGGLRCQAVIQGGNGLNWNHDWMPGIVDYQANGGSFAPHTSRWIRVGNVVHFSGQFDSTTAAAGVLTWLRIWLPLYPPNASGNNGTNAGHGVVTSAVDGETGWINIGISAGHMDIFWTSKSTGNHAFMFTGSYTTT